MVRSYLLLDPQELVNQTLLRCINCLEMADQGEIQIEDYCVNINKITKADKQWIRRNTGMVFQGFYLFNNKTVLQNITEGLIVVKKIKKNEAEEKAFKILEQVGLLEKKDCYPSSLSGGHNNVLQLAGL